MTALLVIGILVLLIVAHEFGHFIVAKMCKVRVEEFGIGYPPRAYTLGKIGYTEYTVNWIPFGGFVRLYGDDASSQHGKGSLQDASRISQALILIAGVAANAILAWVLFAGALSLGVPTVVESAPLGQEAHLFVSDVVPGSPAAAGGLSSGDEILSITDPEGKKLVALTPDAVLNFVRERGGKALTLSYLHEGAAHETSMRPANAVVPGAAGRPALGVGLVLVANQALAWPDALKESFFVTKNAFVVTLQGLGQIASTALVGSLNLKDVVGPVGLVSVIGQAQQNGFGNVMKLAAFISVNLAIINLIPIPALDGGRLFILGVEAILRRAAPKVAVQSLNALGIALIGILMIVVTYHDIARLFV